MFTGFRELIIYLITEKVVWPILCEIFLNNFVRGGGTKL